MRWRWTAFLQACAGLGPIARVLVLVVAAAVLAYFLSCYLVFTPALWVTRTGNLLELLGVGFIFKEVWSAHKEAGVPSPTQEFLLRLKAFWRVVAGPKVVSATGLAVGSSSLLISGGNATIKVSRTTVEARVAQLEEELKQVQEIVRLNRKASDDAAVAFSARIEGQAAQFDSLKLSVESDLKKMATGPTADKLSGAFLVLLGLAMSNFAVWLPT